ncbi:hypothetical protein CEE44_02980 [Candidatus Woesearchaeota archaeon B3_Woes]|nr:MAG: hypothetical protein CEE44_02980 [Candidatus Woesearchaeota archaeon B3_Woes]
MANVNFVNKRLMGCGIRFLFLIILILSSKTIFANIIINEIMYNPNQCSDTYCEWIEVFNNGPSSVNLSGWKISDMKSDLSKEYNRSIIMNQTNIPAGGYLIFAKKPVNFSRYWNVSCPIAEVSFGLNNGQEIVNLYSSNDSLIDSFYYNKSFGADGDGNSLQFFNNSWCTNTPTPGKDNFCPSQPSFILNYPSHVLNDGTIFLIKIEISGFSDGLYDVKIDIKDENGTRIGRIYDTNDKKWKSTTYYVYNSTKVENGSGNYLAYLKIDPDKSYIGTATIQAKLRFSGSSVESNLYIFNVVDTIFSEEETDKENQESESSIEISDVPSSAEFGDIVKAKINVYRGDTSKYAVYAYIETKSGKKATEKSTMHFKNKFTGYTLTVPIQLKPNCDEKYKDGKHIVVVEGLGESDSEKIEIEGIKTSLCGKSSTKTSSTSLSSRKFDYSLINYPKKISSSQEFNINVEIKNDDDQDSEVDIWSYVYRGSKSYSGDRQQNKKHITIDVGSSEIITLTNKVSSLEDGDYKLKVVINKDNQKTNKEIIEEISVSGSGSYSTKCLSAEYSPNFGNPISLAEFNIFNRLLCTESIHYKQQIYESKNEKIKKTLPYFIITLTTLLSIVLIIKKDNF